MAVLAAPPVQAAGKGDLEPVPAGDEAKASNVNDGAVPLTAEHAAEVIVRVAHRPPRVRIDETVRKGTDQAASPKVHRRTKLQRLPGRLKAHPGPIELFCLPCDQPRSLLN